ncbi:DUF2187 domain-containing protein [Salinicoccus cyprini]|uniref:DUF2187 domain-containing protein n=1 Tax=Salinicoccus cyprini TaxID=2493691 RepID=A0A558AT36_9STAP|nr:DUF2187 domain-containing protein [Salinicoccus cyprini]
MEAAKVGNIVEFDDMRGEVEKVNENSVIVNGVSGLLGVGEWE